MRKARKAPSQWLPVWKRQFQKENPKKAGRHESLVLDPTTWIHIYIYTLFNVCMYVCMYVCLIYIYIYICSIRRCMFTYI